MKTTDTSRMVQRSNRIRRMFVMIIPAVVVAWLIWLGLIWAFQETFIFPRFIANRDVAEQVPDDVEAMLLPLDDGGHVESWLLTPDTGSPAPLLVIAHGNAERVDSWIDFARRQRNRGYAVLLAEYRGYGRSDGSPTQKSLVSDTKRFIEMASAKDGVDGQRTGYLGMSIGTAVLAQVALEQPPLGIVMLVPPARIDSFLWRFGAPSFMMRHPFRTDLAVQQLDVPILICSNAQDHIIPLDHGRRLQELALDGEYLEFEGDHNVLFTPDEAKRRQEAIDQFFDSLLRPSM